MVKAYAYIRHLGLEGFQRVSENAIINANYLMRRLQSTFDLPHDQHCQHEFVLSGKKFRDQGVRTLDIAKRLLDFGVHAPTIYFPLNRLEEQGVITSRFGEATAVRGGRRKKIYSITQVGFERLEEYRRVSDLLWHDYLKLSTPEE